MNEEKIYTFNEYVLGYDSGLEDRSCLTINKLQNDTLYVMASLYDGSADVISMMLDNLQQELDQYKNNWEELKKWLNEEGFIMPQDIIDQIVNPNEDKIIYIEDILDKMKELEEKNND